MIARELLVKLGFKIDTAKYAQFKVMSEDVKAKMSSMQKTTRASFTPNVGEALHELSKYNKESRKATGALMAPNVETAFKELSNYNKELKALSKDERRDLLELNKLERQAIAQVTQSHRQKHKEIETFEKARIAHIQKSKEEFQGLLKGVGKLAKGITLATGIVSTGIALSLKSTLNDVKAFKSQKFHGEKTSSKFDKNQLKAVDEFNSSFDKTKNTIAEIRNSLVLSLLPSINKVLVKFQGWLKLNKELISSRLKLTISVIAKGILGLASVIGTVGNAFGGWQRILGGVKLAIGGLGIYKLAASLYLVKQNIGLIKASLWSLLNFKSFATNFKLLFNPITLISAALTGLFLILEDFYVYSKGGKSLIGDLLESDAWKKLKENIQEVIKPLEELKEMFSFFHKKNIKTEIVKPAFTFTREELEQSKLQIQKERHQEEKDDAEIDKNIKNGKFQLLPDVFKNSPSFSEQELRYPSSKVINSSPTFNLTVIVPQGTTASQVDDIAREVQRAQNTFYERMLNAVGAT